MSHFPWHRGELGTELPKYKTNIENRINSFDLSKDNSLATLFKSIDTLEKRLPGPQPPISEQGKKSDSVNVVSSSSTNFNDVIKNFVLALLDVLTSTGLVFLLVVFMLFTREDLRGRLIRLIGPTRISSTTIAMDDASRRVSQYLVSQLLINFLYGCIVTIGLSLIGLPNAILWGSLAMILRFIPYIGIWIAAVLPFLVALAIFPGWTFPLSTLLIFILLDLITANIIEPLLFASKTGVSSLALIISAVFWTLIWGPVGLLLSTPLTVCMIVIGKHIPRFSFLHTLLSDDKGIALYEEFYQNLINLEFTEAMILLGNHLKKNSLVELYDSTVLPVLSASELDRRNEILEEPQINAIYQNLPLILEDIQSQIPYEASDNKKNLDLSKNHILCLPASNERDEIASNMLMQALNASSFRAFSLPVNSQVLSDTINKEKINAICISVVSPYLIIPAKKLTQYLHENFPDLKILIGLWGDNEVNSETGDALKKIGPTILVFSFNQAIAQLQKLFEIHA